MVSVRNLQRKVRIDPRWIKRTSQRALHILGLEGAELSIVFISPKRMRQLNLKYRGIDKETDVLSFEFSPMFLGEIIINPTRALVQSKEHGLTLRKEILGLIVHGILHLIGYDHERNRHEALKMRKKEKEILNSIS